MSKSKSVAVSQSSEPATTTITMSTAPLASPAPPDWLIENILPSREVHLIAGPSGAGKTSWMFDVFIRQWANGQPIFGHVSHATPYVYFSCDRSAPGVERTLIRVGLDPRTVPFVPGVERGISTIEQIFSIARKEYPQAHLLIIEGFAGLMPGGGNKANDYGAVARFLSRITRLCQQHNRTVIGIAHSTKTKENEKYLNPRQRVLGSVAWAAFTETILIFEPESEGDTDNPIRLVMLLPRNAREQTFRMAFNDRGRLEEVRDDDATQFRDAFSEFIAERAAGDIFKTRDLYFALACSRRTAQNLLRRAERDGLIESLKRGQWVVSQAAEAESDLLELTRL